MSDYVFRRFEDMNFSSESNKSHEKDKKTFALKFIVIILSTILLVEAIVYLIIMPSFSQSARISWTGVENTTVYDLMARAGNSLNKSWFSFDRDEVCSLLSTVPGIEDVQVEKIFPDKIVINVIERKAVAMTFVNVDNETKPYKIDKNGVIFPVSKNESFDRNTILISGIPVENIPEGMRIPSKYIPLLSQISDILEIRKNYFAAVSEIHVVPKEYGNYELVLFPENCHTRILTDRALNEDALRYMMIMVDLGSKNGNNVEEIDLRYGSISYRERE